MQRRPGSRRRSRLVGSNAGIVEGAAIHAPLRLTPPPPLVQGFGHEILSTAGTPRERLHRPCLARMINAGRLDQLDDEHGTITVLPDKGLQSRSLLVRFIDHLCGRLLVASQCFDADTHRD
jgi:hypothetical protein